MKFRIMAAVGLIVGAVALAGCGGGDEAEEASPSPQTTTQADRPATTAPKVEPTVEEAARQYEAFAQKRNQELKAAVEEFDATFNGSNYAAIRVYMGKVSAVHQRAMNDLLSVDFPPRLQRQADEVMVSLNKWKTAVDAALNESDDFSMLTALQETGDESAEFEARTAILRNALGLPPAPEFRSKFSE